MRKRKYRQKARADRVQETRQSIIDAAVKLHEEMGPAKTSIKAIAECAGVQRLTVYRHFPDEASLYEACSSQWLGAHPPPAVSDDQETDDAKAKTAKTLLAFYRYYRHTQRMWLSIYGDIDEVEALRGPMNQFESYIDTMRDELLLGWKVKDRDKKYLSLTLRHSLRFSTWHSFKNDKISDMKMVDLVMQWLNNCG